MRTALVGKQRFEIELRRTSALQHATGFGQRRDRALIDVRDRSET
jgi:hypothetical protein